MRVRESTLFTACFARDTESAEENFFFIAVERTAMKNRSAAEAAFAKAYVPIRLLCG